MTLSADTGGFAVAMTAECFCQCTQTMRMVATSGIERYTPDTPPSSPPMSTAAIGARRTWISLRLQLEPPLPHRAPYWNTRACPRLIEAIPSDTTKYDCRHAAFRQARRQSINYFASAASCWFALLTAALTAARKESLPVGACTSPDSVLRKETFLR